MRTLRPGDCETLATRTIVHFFGQATMNIIQSNFTREEEQLRGGGEEGRTDDVQLPDACITKCGSDWLAEERHFVVFHSEAHLSSPGSVIRRHCANLCDLQFASWPCVDITRLRFQMRCKQIVVTITFLPVNLFILLLLVDEDDNYCCY